MRYLSILVLLFITGCTLTEVHVIVDVGDGTVDTVTEKKQDSASLSLTKQ